MFYKEVVSSTVLPVSSAQAQLKTNELEEMFANYLFSKGQTYYNTYRATLLQSNSTFLKNLFDGIDNSYREKITDDQKRAVLRLVISSIINQIKILEEIVGEVDNEALNAIICGVVMKQMKSVFS